MEEVSVEVYGEVAVVDGVEAWVAGVGVLLGDDDVGVVEQVLVHSLSWFRPVAAAAWVPASDT